MKMQKTRHLIMVGVLIFSGLLVACGNADEQTKDSKSDLSDKSAVQRKAKSVQTAALEISQDELEKMSSRINDKPAAKDSVVDIFKSKSWYVPPPPPKPVLPPPPPPPPVPVAPPVPYVFMGSYKGDDGRLIIFLTKGNRVYSAFLGEVLEGTYRVQEIVSGQLVLIYLPLNTRQTISVGEAS
jgi:hypothetical protein